MTVEVKVSTEAGGHVVVALHGLVGNEPVEAAVGLLPSPGAGGGTLVVDLRDAVVTSPRALAQLVDQLVRQTHPARVSVVCDRLSGRRLVRTQCPIPPVEIFTDLRQALAH